MNFSTIIYFLSLYSLCHCYYVMLILWTYYFLIYFLLSRKAQFRSTSDKSYTTFTQLPLIVVIWKWNELQLAQHAWCHFSRPTLTTNGAIWKAKDQNFAPKVRHFHAGRDGNVVKAVWNVHFCVALWRGKGEKGSR